MNAIAKEPKIVLSGNVPTSTAGLLEKARRQYATTRSQLIAAILRDWLSERYEDRKLTVAQLLGEDDKEASNA